MHKQHFSSKNGKMTPPPSLEFSLTCPRTASEKNKRKMDKGFYDDASYTSETEEEIRGSQSKKRRESYTSETEEEIRGSQPKKRRASYTSETEEEIRVSQPKKRRESYTSETEEEIRGSQPKKRRASYTSETEEEIRVSQPKKRRESYTSETEEEIRGSQPKKRRASYTSEIEDEIRGSQPKKRRRTIAAFSTASNHELVCLDDQANKERVASKIEKLKGRLEKNTQTKQYCTSLSQHLKLAKKEQTDAEKRERRTKKDLFREVRIHDDAFIKYQQKQKKERECGDRIAELQLEIASLEEQQAKYKKEKDDLFDLSQNDCLVTQARGIHASAEKEVGIAKEKADDLNKELLPMQERLARDQVQWEGLSPEVILASLGLKPTHDSLLILVGRDLLVLRRAMKRFGVRGAFHFDLSNNKSPAEMRKEVCDVWGIPFDPEKEEPEKVMPQTTAEEIMKAARLFRLDDSDDEEDSE
jgi:hypothetical protein